MTINYSKWDKFASKLTEDDIGEPAAKATSDAASSEAKRPTSVQEYLDMSAKREAAKKRLAELDVEEKRLKQQLEKLQQEKAWWDRATMVGGFVVMLIMMSAQMYFVRLATPADDSGGEVQPAAAGQHETGTSEPVTRWELVTNAARSVGHDLWSRLFPSSSSGSASPGPTMGSRADVAASTSNDYRDEDGLHDEE